MNLSRPFAVLATLAALAAPAVADDSTAYKGHKRDVNAVAISGDGKLLVSGGDDSAVHLWDPTGTATNDRTNEDQGAIKSIAFSPDAKLVAIGNAYGWLTLWDRASGKDVYSKKGYDGSSITAIVFFPDGKQFVTAGNNDELKTWDTASGKELLKIAGHKYTPRSLAMAPDGSRFYSGDEGGNVFVWNAKGKQVQAYEIGKGQIHGIALTKDGKTIASGMSDGAVVFTDASNGKELRRVKLADSVNSVAFSPDAKTLVAGTQGEELIVVDADKATQTKTLKGHSRPITSVAFAADGSSVASASMDMTVRSWPAKTLK